MWDYLRTSLCFGNNVVWLDDSRVLLSGHHLSGIWIDWEWVGVAAATTLLNSHHRSERVNYERSQQHVGLVT